MGSQATQSPNAKRWCARGESNPHVRNGHQILSLARLPIPPPALSTVSLTAEEVVSPLPLFKNYFKKKLTLWNRHRPSVTKAILLDKAIVSVLISPKWIPLQN